MRYFWAVIALILSSALPAAGQDFNSARAAGPELRQICEQDRGRHWGVSLCGPLLVADPNTRGVWASEIDGYSQLTRSGDAWLGVLPAGVPIANTTVEWSGTRWIMVVGPLPEDAQQRRVLVAHEAWHRVQDQIGLPAAASDCAHLETVRARYLLRLEMRALAAAMRSSGRAQRELAVEALGFRAARLAEFPQAAAQEAALDRNEGLAAYTGVRLGADNPSIFAARTLDQYDAHEAFSRAYAYATGPAYGLLLDEYANGWRARIGPYSPPDMLAAELRAQAAPAGRALNRSAERYGGLALLAQETERAAIRAARVAELQNLYGAGPRLELPLAQMQFEFDPNQVTPVDGLGSFYGRLTLRDRWGEIVATEGAVIDQSFTRLTAARPAPGGLAGPGWQLRLNPGYALLPADSAGVVRVVQVAE